MSKTVKQILFTAGTILISLLCVPLFAAIYRGQGVSCFMTLLFAEPVVMLILSAVSGYALEERDIYFLAVTGAVIAYLLYIAIMIGSVFIPLALLEPLGFFIGYFSGREMRKYIINKKQENK